MSLVENDSTHGKLGVNKSSVLWTIKNFSRIEMNCGERINSPTFECLGNTWLLRLYPNGNTIQSVNYLSLFLLPQNTINYPLPVLCSISIITNKNDGIGEYQYKNEYKEVNSGYGNSKYISRKNLLENTQVYLPNDELTIFWTIEEAKIQDDIEIPKSEHSVNLKKIFRNQEFGDVTFCIDGGKIKAYKGNLAAQSDVFNAMFKHEDMKENQKNEVDIVDFTRSAFEKMLEFIYTGDTPDYDDDTKDLMKLADKYHLERLKCLCEQELYKKITSKNAVELLILADTYSAAQLKKKSLEYVAAHLTNVLKSKGFNNIVTSNPQLAVELMQEIDNQRTSEEK